MKSFSVISLILALFLAACTTRQEDSTTMKKAYGTLPDGNTAFLYTLKNKNGMEATITNYGGIVVSLMAPDSHGTMKDIVLGYDSLSSYVANNPYFGALIGRYGNRIGKGTFKLNDVQFKLAANNGENHLHGGLKGFDKVLWEVRELEGQPGKSLVLRYHSEDGEEGYPGRLSVRVVYALSDSNELKIDYEATTDKPTVVNLTHHSYFNLAGAGNGDILGHELEIMGDTFTPVDDGLIPTGELKAVKDTPMDFTTPSTIGARVAARDVQIQRGGGYDHNWALNKPAGTFGLAARVSEPTSGRVMEVWTTEPGLQFYSGNFLDGSNIGKGGVSYKHRYGFCLETQHFPDSPNKPSFPSTVLNPGETYTSSTLYRFLTR